MVIITVKRKGELMRKTSEKILRTLLAVSVLTTAVLSSGCLDDEEEISDSTASGVWLLAVSAGIKSARDRITPNGCAADKA